MYVLGVLAALCSLTESYVNRAVVAVLGSPATEDGEPNIIVTLWVAATARVGTKQEAA